MAGADDPIKPNYDININLRLLRSFAVRFSIRRLLNNFLHITTQETKFDLAAGSMFIAKPYVN